MKEKISHLHSRIEVEGTEKEIKKLVLALDEVITKGMLKEEIGLAYESLKKNNESIQINPSRIDRIYLTRNSLIYLPNSSNPAFHFPILKDKYVKAKELLEIND